MSDEKQLGQTLSLLFQAHPWHGIDPGEATPGKLTCFIEIVPTDAVKYEVDKPSGHLKIDRPQRFSSICPTLYGFVPQSYCGDKIAELSARSTGKRVERGDGDPMDICVLTERPIAHGNIIVQAHPIGGMLMIDHGEADDKIIAVLEQDLSYGQFKDITDCPPALIERLKHYFLSYKKSPDGPEPVEIASVYGREHAFNVINTSFEDYRDKFGTPMTHLARLHELLAAAK
ncbi:MAG: inorganic pyrophosphatase [Candidatus Obscuribacterales bacterium]|nr:inorganic pyrophosphatase [Candidatus Obscuribacterales bacterium]